MHLSGSKRSCSWCPGQGPRAHPLPCWSCRAPSRPGRVQSGFQTAVDTLFCVKGLHAPSPGNGKARVRFRPGGGRGRSWPRSETCCLAGASSDPVTAEGSGAVTAPAHTARRPGSPEGSGEKWEALCHDAASWGEGEPEWSDGLEPTSSPSEARTPSLREGRRLAPGGLLCGELDELERRRDASRTG